MNNQDREVILKIEDLAKSFGQTDVLKGINMEVRKNEIISVLGPSGCGKSTTGKLMVKLLTPTEGAITFEGKDINKLSRQEDFVFKRKVQLVFQDP